MSQFTVNKKDSQKAWDDAFTSWRTYRKKVKNGSEKNPLDASNNKEQTD